MILENIAGAFDAVFHLKNLILMSVGVAAGLVTGAIPGFTITMAVVLTLPFTFGMTAVEGISTMIGVNGQVSAFDHETGNIIAFTSAYRVPSGLSAVRLWFNDVVFSLFDQMAKQK